MRQVRWPVVIGPMIALAATGESVRAAIIFVRANATGANNGTTWNDAFTRLEPALALAQPQDQVWVAASTYRPSANNNRGASFFIRDGIAVFGGFVGGETSLGQRNPTVNITTLSGDLNANDGAGFANYADNSRHVVDFVPGAAPLRATLDGFTVRGGNADGPDGGGGGIIVHSTQPPGIANCVVMRNRSSDQPGGIDGNAALQNVVVSGNAAAHGPGGMRVPSAASLNNVTFSDNQGGGMTIESLINLTAAGVTFSNNTGGGGLVVNPFGGPIMGEMGIFNGTFDSNTGTHGGGLAVQNASACLLGELVFRNNTADGPGGGAAITMCPNLALNHCTFSRNVSGINGGGLSAMLCPQARIVRCDFSGNHSFGNGGGLAVDLDGAPRSVVNCRFFGNTCSNSGGGVFGSADLTNGLFSGNSVTGPSGMGGGMFGSGFIAQCTFSRNSVTGLMGSAGGFGRGGAGPTNLVNCIFSENTAAGLSQIGNAAGLVSFSLVQGGFPGGGNINANPLYIDVNGADNMTGTPDDDLRLQPNSPGIDAGNSNAVPPDIADLNNNGNTSERTPLDLANLPRFVDDPQTPDTGPPPPPIVDMGAYEFFEDCNHNGTNDTTDILLGTSLDLDHNGIPDECTFSNVAAGFWSNPSTWEPPIVPNNDVPPGRHFAVTLRPSSNQIILDINARIDTLLMRTNSILRMLQGNLSIARSDSIYNAGEIILAAGHFIIAEVPFTLSGPGMITMQPGSGIASTALPNLITSDTTVHGAGIISATLTNNGLISADSAGNTLFIAAPGPKINNNIMQATASGTLRIQVPIGEDVGAMSHFIARGGTILIDSGAGPITVDGCGPIEIDPGSPGVMTLTNATVRNFASVTIGDATSGTGRSGTLNLSSTSRMSLMGPATVRPNGTLNLGTGCTLSATQFTVESGGTLAISGTLESSGLVSNNGADESRWSFTATSVLRLKDGAASCTGTNWTRLEVGGVDSGAGIGYANNFNVPTLDLPAAASVMLVDLIDNGNRNGSGGAAEAFYVNTLTLGAGATLNLNGLHLYAGGAAVLPGPRGGGTVVSERLTGVTGDANGNGVADADDIQRFTSAIMTGVVPLGVLCTCDFDISGTITGGDLAGFVAALLGP